MAASTDALVRIRATDETKAAFNSAIASVNELRSRAASLGDAFRTIQSLAVGSLVGKFFIDAKQAAIEAADASARLAATLRATGDAVGYTQDKIEQLSDQLGARTAFEPSQIQAAAAELVKFGTVSGIAFDRALKAAADWARFTNSSMPEAAQQIGQALAATEGGLGRFERQIGKISYSEEKFIKDLEASGDTLGAQNEKLRIIESRIGGVAEAMNKGLAGATREAATAWQELLEGVGKTSEKVGYTERVMRGLTSLLRDITLESQGTRTPLRSMGDDLLEVASKASFAVRVLVEFNRARQLIAEVTSSGGLGPSATGRISGLGDKGAEASGVEAARRAREDAALKRGDEADKKLVKEIEERRKQAATAALAAEKQLTEEGRRSMIAAAEEIMKSGDELIFTWTQAGERIAIAKKEFEELEASAKKLAEQDLKGMLEAIDKMVEASDDMVTTWTKSGQRIEISRQQWDAMQDSANDLKDVARDLGLTFSSAFEDAIVAGKSFQDILTGIEKDIVRIIARELVTKPLASSVQQLIPGVVDWFKNMGGSSGGGAASGGLQGFATGIDFVPRNMAAFLHRGEAVIPASENRAGGGGDITINVVGASGPVQARKRQDDSGGVTLDLIVGQISQQQAGDIGSGRGPLSAMLERTYGLSRVPGSFR